uniref:Uncharacterized protein n=1 Tax=uncultured marine virus TaxID=186617 RepID=A0A0F7L318_9VIRU|nr:hypothetical protein [uncultured marine virus]
MIRLIKSSNIKFSFFSICSASASRTLALRLPIASLNFPILPCCLYVAAPIAPTTAACHPIRITSHTYIDQNHQNQIFSLNLLLPILTI